MRRL
ncbi:hypothetical protein YPPY03_4968, partial [Yersinia pestis PY-03]|jgi:small multidrug resistance pump